jgi:hypothetical protein
MNRQHGQTGMNGGPDRGESSPRSGRPAPSSGRPAAPGRSIVGGLPFAAGNAVSDPTTGSVPVPAAIVPPPSAPPANGQASSTGTRALPPVRSAAAAPPVARQRERATPRDPGAAVVADIVATIRGWLRSLIGRLRRPSPAFLTSLVVHALALLVLALIVVRAESRRAVRLEMRFGDGGPSAEDAVSIDAPAAAAEPPPEPAKPPPRPAEAMTPLVEPEPEPEPVPPSPLVGTGRDESARLPIESLLAGRSDAGRADGLSASGGDDATEQAVTLALDWIVRQQQKSGLWSLKGPYDDGGNQENHLAATAMALMALQGAGTHDGSGRHAGSVARGWAALLDSQRPDGTFDTGAIPDQHAMYAHAQATIAICEASAMAEDAIVRRRLEEAAARAVGYALAGQMPDGGWRYGLPGRGGDDKGDMSVTGWFLMALRTAEMAGIAVPPAAYARLTAFVDAVELTEASGICVDDRGLPTSGYGYQIFPNQKVFPYRPALAAEGLLCRQHLGWDRDDPRMTAGVAGLLERSPINFRGRGKNVYAWYYQTQVFHNVGGAAWERWNDVMRKALPQEQVKQGREKGSWDTTYDQWGSTAGGRLYMTSLLALMLESYYRHLPVYQATVTTSEISPPNAPGLKAP